MSDERVNWEEWAAEAALTGVPSLMRDLAAAVNVLGEHPDGRARDAWLALAASSLRTAADELDEARRATFDAGWHMGRAAGLLDASDADREWRARVRGVVSCLADAAAVHSPSATLDIQRPPPGPWITDVAAEAERIASGEAGEARGPGAGDSGR